MNLLGKDQILGADDRAYDIVPCPEWAGDVRLRSLTGDERDEWETSLVHQVGNKQVINSRNMRAKLVARCAVDKDGLLLFTAADVIKLGTKNAKPLDRLFEACQRLCGISDEDVKEMEEGFDETQDERSASASRLPWVAPSANSSPASRPVS